MSLRLSCLRSAREAILTRCILLSSYGATAPANRQPAQPLHYFSILPARNGLQISISAVKLFPAQTCAGVGEKNALQLSYAQCMWAIPTLILSGFALILSGFALILSGFALILSGFALILSGFALILSGFALILLPAQAVHLYGCVHCFHGLTLCYVCCLCGG